MNVIFSCGVNILQIYLLNDRECHIKCPQMTQPGSWNLKDSMAKVYSTV